MSINVKEAFAVTAAKYLKGILQNPDPSMAPFEVTNFKMIVTAAKILGALPKETKVFEVEALRATVVIVQAYQALGLTNEAREVLQSEYQRLGLPDDVVAATLAAMTPRERKPKAK